MVATTLLFCGWREHAAASRLWFLLEALTTVAKVVATPLPLLNICADDAISILPVCMCVCVRFLLLLVAAKKKKATLSCFGRGLRRARKRNANGKSSSSSGILGDHSHEFYRFPFLCAWVACVFVCRLRWFCLCFVFFLCLIGHVVGPQKKVKHVEVTFSPPNNLSSTPHPSHFSCLAFLFCLIWVRHSILSSLPSFPSLSSSFPTGYV